LAIVALLGFILLVAGPIVIALAFGGKLLDKIEQNRAAQRRRKRTQMTRALPIESESIRALLDTEISGEELDDRIAGTLESFRALAGGHPLPLEVAENSLKEVERSVLFRESRFITYLDLAHVQSEIIETLHDEATLLRRLGDVPRISGATSTQRTDDVDHADDAPVDRLRANIDEAVKRRERADNRLRDLQPGRSRIDLTVGEEPSEGN
tara:strand:+ start:1313 stop:1942 length:630 start_codon:yes stop_codon:yes gene_type:complete